MGSDLMGNFRLSEGELLSVYNYVPDSLLRCVIEVSITSESLSQGNGFCFSRSNKGNYWVVKTEDELDWLLPRARRRFNIYEFSTLECLFECRGYLPEGSRDFLVRKPALVCCNASGVEWMLREKGILEFGEVSPLARLEAVIAQAQEERAGLLGQLENFQIEVEGLKRQLQVSERECEILQGRLSKSEEEKGKLLLLSLQLQETVREKDEQLQETVREKDEQLRQFVREKDEQLRQFVRQKDKECERLLLLLESEQVKGESLQSRVDRLTEISARFVDRFANVAREFQQESRSIFGLDSSSEDESELVLSDGEREVVNSYNDKSLKKDWITDVISNKDNVEKGRGGEGFSAIFERDDSGKGKYWVITGADGCYLVPNWKKTLNNSQMRSMQSFFECWGYDPNETDLRRFKLVKPAKVSVVDAGETWQLMSDGKGILDFSG